MTSEMAYSAVPDQNLDGVIEKQPVIDWMRVFLALRPKETKHPSYSLEIRECLNNSAIKYLEGSRSRACLRTVPTIDLRISSARLEILGFPIGDAY